jgi:hypothetical protein
MVDHTLIVLLPRHTNRCHTNLEGMPQKAMMESASTTLIVSIWAGRGASENADGQTQAICPLPLHLRQMARFHLGDNIIGDAKTGEAEEDPE